MDKKELTKRILSIFVLLPIVTYLIYLGNSVFIFFLGAMTGLMLLEAKSIINNFGISFNRKRLWRSGSFVYILIAVFSLFLLRKLNNGFFLTIWICSIIWCTDIFALFFGKKFGGPKLAPKISPNKTWSGSFGGVLGASIITMIFYQFNSHNYNLCNMLIIGLFLSVIGQIGDLIESYFKRVFKVKDSGDIIPGHGGILDRCDSLLLASPIAFLLFYLFPRILNVS